MDASPTRRTTLLQALMTRRNLTREKTVQLLAERARTMGVPNFSLELRQLDRLLAGQFVDGPRASTRQVLEAEFDFPIDLLLGPEDRVALAGGRSMFGEENRRVLRSAGFVTWLAERSGTDLESVYAFVAETAEQLAALPVATRAAHDHARAALPRSTVAAAVQRYYDSPAEHFYKARVAGASSTEDLAISLSVLTEPRWIGLGVPLDAEHERPQLTRDPDASAIRMTPPVFLAAVNRLAAVEVGDSVLVDNPLYRLLELDINAQHVEPTFGLTTFAAYALTTDLMETELVNSLVDHPDRALSELPVRDEYLPTIQSATAFAQRICAGGPACLLSIARAEEDDYLLIVQQRSRRVLNATGRLAVLPKAFHQPLSASEVHDRALSATLNRELEEELLGRVELDQISPEARRRLAPGHSSTRSEPMRWFDDHPNAYLLQCTGFGINMLSGNYEVACLAIIDDPSWWTAYGGTLQTNWEVDQSLSYSTRDPDALLRLIADPRWSDEGLFALLEGLRCLHRHCPEKVHLPSIEVTL